MIRKTFLPAALALTLAILTAKSAFCATPDTSWTRDDAAHLLRRAAFSGTPKQIDQLFAMGKEAAVDYLLTGKLPPNAAAPFAPVKLDPIALPKDADPKAEAKRPNGDIQSQWLARMITTDRPLEEKMTLFWHGLFTSGIREVKNADEMLAQNKLFHDQALGNYKTLTLAIIHDPAMLKYLNNNENVKGKPNENLARELCELFTMGEGKGYTEKDIGEIARALTGATVTGGKKADGNYVFRPNEHDTAPKTIFGKTGNYKPEDVVELIFDQPEPPEHLARRLWEFFAYPDPTDKEIAPVAAAIRDSHFEVAPALRALFLSPDFYSEKAKFAIIKSPPDLLVSTIRMLGEDFNTPAQEKIAASAVASMGQTLLEPPNVRGWPGGENWITAATLFSRYNTATALVSDNLRPEQQNKPGKNINQAGKKPPNKNRASDNAGAHAPSPKTLFPDLPTTPTAEQVVNAAVARFLQRPLHPEKIKVLVDSMGKEPLRLGEAVTDSRIREMIGLLLSTPEYQVE